MRKKLRSHIRHNVIGYIALFVALGGTGAYAANTIGSSDVINESLLTQDIRGKSGNSTTAAVNGTLTGADISGQPANSSVGQPFVEGSLTGADIRNGSVTAGDVGNGAITPQDFGTIPAARVVRLSNQSVPNGTPTNLRFDHEEFDTAGLHNNAVDNHLLTAPIDGLYQVSGGVIWDSNGTGERTLDLRGGGGATRTSATKAGLTVQSSSGLARLFAGESVLAEVEQDSGASLDVLAFPATYLAMHWVGPLP